MVSPALTCWPSVTATLMTVPCMGAVRAFPERDAPGSLRPAPARGGPLRAGRAAPGRLPFFRSFGAVGVPGWEVVVVFGLDPPGVDGERARFAVQFRGEGGSADDGAVERQSGGEPGHLELGQGPDSAARPDRKSPNRHEYDFPSHAPSPWPTR
jgi:hypothetical protein